MIINFFSAGTLINRFELKENSHTKHSHIKLFIHLFLNPRINMDYSSERSP